MAPSTYTSFYPLQKMLSINLSNIKNSELFLRTLRIEPWTAGWEARTLPLCYANPFELSNSHFVCYSFLGYKVTGSVEPDTVKISVKYRFLECRWIKSLPCHLWANIEWESGMVFKISVISLVSALFVIPPPPIFLFLFPSALTPWTILERQVLEKKLRGLRNQT